MGKGKTMKVCNMAMGMALLLLTGLASAAANCPKAPESQWMHVLAMQKKIVNEYGMAIKKFQTDGNCYEIYGWAMSADGKRFERVEVYFNPVNGEIVKKVVQD
jgi:hypothetical protein